MDHNLFWDNFRITNYIKKKIRRIKPAIGFPESRAGKLPAVCDDKHLKLILPHHWSCKSQTAPLLWEGQHGLNMDQVFSRSQYSLSVMSTPQPWVTSNTVQDYSVYTVPCASALKQHVMYSGRGWINSQHWLVGSQKGRATIFCILYILSTICHYK